MMGLYFRITSRACVAESQHTAPGRQLRFPRCLDAAHTSTMGLYLHVTLKPAQHNPNTRLLADSIQCTRPVQQSCNTLGLSRIEHAMSKWGLHIRLQHTFMVSTNPIEKRHSRQTLPGKKVEFCAAHISTEPANPTHELIYTHMRAAPWACAAQLQHNRSTDKLSSAHMRAAPRACAAQLQHNRSTDELSSAHMRAAPRACAAQSQHNRSTDELSSAHMRAALRACAVLATACSQAAALNQAAESVGANLCHASGKKVLLGLG
eukprot:1161917-Pelagomonas_calceolata.AAC.2